MAGGFFKVNRAMLDHPIFAGQPDRIAAWVWMLATAAFRDTRLDAGGKTVNIKRGQLLTSYRQMSKATGVSVQTLRTLLRRLQDENAINTETNTGRLLVTICNYEKYQASDDEANTARNTASTQHQHTKERREEDNIRLCVDHSTRDELFERFWEVFPHRHGVKKDKKKAKEKWNQIARNPKHDLSRIAERAKAYRNDGAVLAGYGKGPVPWLNGECWNDEIEPPRRAARPASTQPDGDGFEENLKRRYGLT